jgi:hypothetical protein
MRQNDEARLTNRLTNAMSLLAGEFVEAAAPPELESMLLAEFHRASRLRRRRRWYWATPAGAIAASIAALWIAESRPRPKENVISASPSGPAIASAVIESPRMVAQPMVTRPTRARAAAPQATPELEQPFVPIPYVTPLDPLERFNVVRMELPVAALIAAGLVIQTADAGARAEADVVVGQDGRARAVRLISISNVN